MTRRLCGFGLAIPLLALLGCGREAQPRTPAATVAELPADPWATLPLDSLYGATATENLRTVRVELELRGVPRGWSGMRFAVLSDLLLGLWAGNAEVAEAAVQRAVEANPDVIVLLGNYLAENGDPAELGRVLAPLQGRSAVAILGERDVRTDTLAAAVERVLRARGVHVLRNTAMAFARGVDTAYVVGLAPNFGALTAGQQAEIFASVPEGAPSPLVLAPFAELLPRLPADRFQAVFAGNVFCGELDLPGVPRLGVLQQERLPQARVPQTERLFRTGGNTLFVTCGTGYGFLPVRFAPPPEVALVTLLRLPEPAAPTAAAAEAPP